MPQPLSKVRHLAAIDLEVSSIMEEPELAALIGGIISACSILDAKMAESLAELMGTKAEFGVAIHYAIVSGPAQAAVLDAVAEKALSGRRRELLKGLVRLAGKAMKSRHRVAHGLWGHSPDIPKALLCIPPEVEVDLRARIKSLFRNSKRVRKAPLYLLTHDRSKILVYKMQDLVNLHRQIARAVGHFGVFLSAIRMRDTHHVERARRFRSLYNEPDIQEELLRSREDPRNTPKSPKRLK